jgi:hypothetical protein
MSNQNFFFNILVFYKGIKINAISKYRKLAYCFMIILPLIVFSMIFFTFSVAKSCFTCGLVGITPLENELSKVRFCTPQDNKGKKFGQN